MPILRLARSAFDPEAIAAMSLAFVEACAALNIPDSDEQHREVIATRIIDLARNGKIDAAALRDRIIQEAQAAASTDPDVRARWGSFVGFVRQSG